MKKNNLTLTQKIKVSKDLDSVLEFVGPPEDKIVKYKEGWDDAGVAKSQPFITTSSNVGSIRIEVYGNLQRGGGTRPPSEETQRLERRIEALESCVHNLILVVNGLSPAKIATDKLPEQTKDHA